MDNEHKVWSVVDVKNSITDLISGKYDRTAREINEKLQKEDGCRKAADLLEAYLDETEKREKQDDCL